MARLVCLFGFFALVFPVISLKLNLDIGGIVKGLLGKDDSQKFTNFLTKYGKNYKTADEVKERAKIWKENLQEINKENEGRGKEYGYTLGENQFTDMTPEERAKYVMDANIADEADEAMKSSLPRAKRGSQVLTYPGETIDWRFTQWMPSVRDQGQCGACYAFAAINAIEVQWNWLGHSSQFSEQQIIDCAGSNQGCNGGWPEKVFNYSKYYGNAARSAYPYTAVKGTCYNTARTMTVSTWYQLTSVSQIESYNYYYGPVAFSMYVPNALYSYTGGIFYPTQSTCTSSNNVGAHAMTIVGYGTDNNKPYWIIRNSWGATWGEGGYFRMYKGVNNCGMETRGVFFPWIIGNSG